MKRTTGYLALALGSLTYPLQACLLGPPVIAHADPITDAGDTSWVATCTVLGKELDGIVADDTGTVMGVAAAIGKHYGFPTVVALTVENYQVQTYCPTYWPNLVNVGKAARGGTTI